MSKKSSIDTAELGRNIKKKRLELKLNLRELADITKVSASTLSRIENGTGKPDAENIAALSAWLNVPVDRIVKGTGKGGEQAVVVYTSENLPEIVRAHLRADKNMSAETAEALAELFTVAYRQVADGGSKKK